MIFERRAYMLKPGRDGAFWDAQETWNTPEVFGPILTKNLFYGSHSSHVGTLIVHLYGYESLDQWQALYAAYYHRQSAEYFKTVRPWMLSQENSFYRPFAVADLNEAKARWPLRGSWAQAPEADQPQLLETTIDLPPGGLPAFIARDDQSYEYDAAWRLISLIGRQHRIVDCRICPSSTAATLTAEAITERLERYDEPLGEIHHRHLVLRLSPLASRRQAFETERAKG